MDTKAIAAMAATLGERSDKISAIRAIIDAAGGKREYLINWEWAKFEDEAMGSAVFALVCDHCEHRGFHPAEPTASNPNLRLAAFRFR